MKILIAGAGGLCCELLKHMKTHPYDITVVDYDKVELSNLNRSMFYTESDIILYKTDVLSKLGYKTINKRIQDVNLDSYKFIISTVDNLEGRMDVNFMFKESNSEYLIDVGVKGLKGHVKLVNHNNSCLYCIKEVYDKEEISCTRRNDDVIPSVCYFNSLVTGFVLLTMRSPEKVDFLFFNFEEQNYFEKVVLKKDQSCIVCNKPSNKN